jgi:ATP-dependent RNA helicase SUPV3L1/SUV3
MKLIQKEVCMVGPDLEIFKQVNNALKVNGLPELKLSEFLRLFNTMTFKKPFFCVELKEMIELAEMVEGIDKQSKLSTSEIFGFACAPVNLGLLNHVQYYVWILGNYVNDTFINYEPIDSASDDIDYLETSIKCVELFQWLARHFNNKNFSFDQYSLIENKTHAIEKLNDVLSKKIVPKCTSCGAKLDDNSKFAICEACFSERRRGRRGPSMHDDRRRFEKSDKNFRPHHKRGPSNNEPRKEEPRKEERRDDRREDRKGDRRPSQAPVSRKFTGPKKPATGGDTTGETSKAAAFKKYR